MKCIFEKAWIGKCGKPVVEGKNVCAEHANEKCASCGAPATHDCGETGQFVCGAPLCNDCEHTTYPDGTNGGIGFMSPRLTGELQEQARKLKPHCKKTEQVFEPWYMQENTK
jgi:hypothetical protein